MSSTVMYRDIQKYVFNFCKEQLQSENLIKFLVTVNISR